MLSRVSEFTEFCTETFDPPEDASNFLTERVADWELEINVAEHDTD